MTTTRKQHSPQFKARVVIEAIRGQKTLSQLGSQLNSCGCQVSQRLKTAQNSQTGQTARNPLEPGQPGAWAVAQGSAPRHRPSAPLAPTRAGAAVNQKRTARRRH